ncbi:Protein of unknown function [Aeromonas sp. RU39B]|uniref:lysozyme inhibitor LprI family protein n=1 Tax=Aeromonas sp. RU39B TaxID=1907416 RepID=UPI0009563DA6|nr:lysozyme inhibitor LprI family protein [Aeromonas sp. RU39B]SIQ62298.1 Protein of unknown function [Aeromonas sp. RU39B]
MNRSSCVRLSLALLTSLPLWVHAAPSFDCSKASGAVETLICNDPALAELDNRLTALYPKAVADFPTEDVQKEQALQRGWLAGRNQCAKADDVRGCVQQSYRQRISELQIKGGETMVPSPVSYRCEHAVSLDVYYYDQTELPSAVINLSEDGLHLQEMAYADSPASQQTDRSYVGRNLNLLRAKEGVTLERDGQPPLQCQPQAGSSE